MDQATGLSGSDFTAVYDGMDRRIRTLHQPIAGGANAGRPTAITSFYDPQVEFLELGLGVAQGSGTLFRTWKIFGPDLNGSYGGLQGIGGLEAIIILLFIRKLPHFATLSFW